MSNEPSVLVVDPSGETREVLQTVLQRRGMNVLGAEGPRRGLALARQHHPDLVVLDMETESSDEARSASLCDQSLADGRSVIVLGQIRRGVPVRQGEEFLAKPYHYGVLIRKIEELLSSSSQALGRSA